jgi:hypothetical protein
VTFVLHNCACAISYRIMSGSAASAASRASRADRDDIYLRKTGMETPLSPNCMEQEDTLQNLVTSRIITEAKAALLGTELGSDTIRVYYIYPYAVGTNTEHWRQVDFEAIPKIVIMRPNPPAPFSTPAEVERSTIGKLLSAKRSKSFSNHEKMRYDVTVVVYRVAFKFCVGLVLTLASVDDEAFERINFLCYLSLCNTKLYEPPQYSGI